MAPPHLVFKDGGALDEHHFYVERLADRQLPEALLCGEFCYVLAPRQMGKSSLRYRVARQLSAQSVRVATLDLTAIGGTTVSADEWYYGLLHVTAKQVGGKELCKQFHDFWFASAPLAPVQRFSLAMREIVLGQTTGDIVILIDEVDVVRVLPFSSDDFFAAVRAFYNARPDDAEYRRLRLCLLGVAQPGDLIRNEQITPFNIGTRIDLTDFERPQLDVFAAGLVSSGHRPHALLDAIFGWTNGHPYMTQRLCAALVSADTLMPAERPGQEAAIVKALVRKIFLRSIEARDANLAYAEKSFEKSNQDPRILKMLDLYSRLQRGQTVLADGRDEVQGALQLTGMVASSATQAGRILHIRNSIFAVVFDEGWVRKLRADRYLSEPTSRWLDSGRDENFVLRGDELRAAEEWSEGRDDLTVQEQLFLRTCSRVARELGQVRLRVRTTWFLTIGIVILLIMLIVTASLSIKARNEYLARDQANRRLAERLVEEIEAKKREVTLVARDQANRRLAERLVEEIEAKKREVTLVKQRQAVETAKQQLERVAAQKQQSELMAQKLKTELSAQKQVAELLAQKQEVEQVAQQRELGLRTQVARRTGEALALARDPEKALAALVVGMEVARTELGLPNSSKIHMASLQGLYSAGQRNVPMRFILGTTSPLNLAVFSPAGFSILSTSDDGQLTLWSTKDGSKLPMLGGQPRQVRAADFCTATTLIIVYQDDRIGILDLKTGQVRHLPDQQSFHCRQAQCSPDGQAILLVGDDKEVRILALSLARPVRSSGFPGMGPVAKSRDEGGVARGEAPAPPLKGTLLKEESSLVFLNDTTVNKPLLLRHDDLVTSASFSPNGRLILTTSNDQTARLWETKSGKQQLVLTGHQGAVIHGSFSPDGRQIATAGQDRTVRIYETSNGARTHTFSEHTDIVSYVKFSPDGKTLVTASTDKTALVWNIARDRILQRLGGHTAALTSASFSPDGTTVLTASRDRTIRSWAALSPRAGLAIELVGHEGPVRSASFSPDGKHVVTGGKDGTVRIFRARDGRELHNFEGNFGAAAHARYSADGQTLVVARRAGYAQLLDPLTGQERRRLIGHSGPLTYAEFSADGRLVVTASEDRTARIFDAERGTLLQSLHSGHLDVVTHAGFSADGKFVVTSGQDDIACIWEVASGALMQVISLTSPMVPLLSAQFSPDDRFIALAALDPLLHVWDVSKQSFVHEFERRGGKLNSARFSTDGLWVVAASEDGTADVFRAEEVSESFKLKGQRGAILDAEFSPNGKWVVTAGADGLALIHPLLPEPMFRHACCVLRAWRDHTPLPITEEEFENANQICRPEWQKADCADRG